MAYIPYGFQSRSPLPKRYNPFQTPSTSRNMFDSYNALDYTDDQSDPYQLPQPTRDPVDLPIKFGQNINLQAPPAQTSQPPDFMSRVNDIYKNTPNRLAYQQAVQEGAPEIHRGKWAQLGAALAAGAAGLADPKQPGAAYSLGRSAFLEPQRRSDEAYKQKIAGLGNLATMEDSDIEKKIRALEMQQGEYYKQKDLELRQAEGRRQDADSIRQGKLTDVQIEHIRKQMEKEGSKTWTDEMTGITYEQDENGKITFQKKTKLTPEEQAIQEGRVTAAKEKELEPGRLARDRSDREQARESATIAAGSRERVAETNKSAKLEAISARFDREMNKPNATEEYKRMILNLKTAMVNEPYLADYIKQAPDGNFIPKDESDFYFPDDNDRANIRKVKAAMLAGAPSGGGRGAVNKDPAGIR